MATLSVGLSMPSVQASLAGGYLKHITTSTLCARHHAHLARRSGSCSSNVCLLGRLALQE